MVEKYGKFSPKYFGVVGLVDLGINSQFKSWRAYRETDELFDV